MLNSQYAWLPARNTANTWVSVFSLRDSLQNFGLVVEDYFVLVERVTVTEGKYFEHRR
jgi:hypothetical protein